MKKISLTKREAQAAFAALGNWVLNGDEEENNQFFGGPVGSKAAKSAMEKIGEIVYEE